MLKHEIALAVTALMDCERQQLDGEMTYLEVHTNAELPLDLPMGNRTDHVVRRLQGPWTA